MASEGARGRGPEGVAIRIRGRGRGQRQTGGGQIPRVLFWGLAAGTIFYLAAHYSIVTSVWPVHGTASGSGVVLARDLVFAAAWLLLVVTLRMLGYRGNWGIIALPIVVFLLTRPSEFQLFTDPVYRAPAGARADANTLKAERSQLTTILRAYDPERLDLVFQGTPPELPNPLSALSAASRPAEYSALRIVSMLTVILAPLAVLIGFLWARRPRDLRWLRDHRRWPFGIVLAIFFVLTFLPGVRTTGKLAGTTPWELFLPVFVLVWAAVLADDAYNLARPTSLMAGRRVLGLLAYGALPLVPFLLLHELGLSIVLAGSLAVMLLVGTRRGWWAVLMLVVWTGLVVATFNVDARSRTRLELAIEPYRDLSAMPTDSARQRWGEKMYQIKLFDANVLEGGWLGDGPGRGHAETAPNAADDGYITTVAAQWGWAGALAFVLVYCAFLIQMLSVAVAERGAFERSTATGLAMLIAIPFWLATLGGIRVIPLTGVAAAFAAHGGAKLTASALAVGIIAGLSHLRAGADRLDRVLAPPENAPDAGVRIR